MPIEKIPSRLGLTKRNEIQRLLIDKLKIPKGEEAKFILENNKTISSIIDTDPDIRFLAEQGSGGNQESYEQAAEILKAKFREKEVEEIDKQSPVAA